MVKNEIRVLLRHYWKQGFNVTAYARKICEVEGKDVVSNRVAQIWLKKFTNGNMDFVDKSRFADL